MSFSLDTPSTTTLKSEARALRAARAATASPITHGAALEEVARNHGYRDWNTASAALPDRAASPLQVAQRVKGTYLGRPFAGLVLGVHMLADMSHFEVTVKLDRPVDVSRSELLGPILRHRLRATVDLRGISAAQTSDGQPHMRISRV
ncbi:glyoxalase superfamily protein [Devosia sp.]|uniref:glyoxalase superfamily protein n=1 Tax=Devosia sp. TaxID=1871048 RepID=UPI003A903D06